MSVTKPQLFWNSVRHTRLGQLYHRLRLTAKRKLRQRLALSMERYRGGAGRAPLPELRHWLPPIMAPRCELVVEREAAHKPHGQSLNGQRHGAAQRAEIVLRFLGEEVAFGEPYNWRPEERQHGTRLWLLNLHYMEYLEGLSDAAFKRLVLDWAANVTPHVRGYWLDVWNCYALSIRVVVWMQQLALRPGVFSDAEEARILASLVQQLRFLVANLELDIGGNHLCKNIKALLWAGAVFAGPEADAWRQLGSRLLERELGEQVLDDGFHFELSPAYHNQVLVDLLECYHVLPAGPLRQRLGEQLARMVQVTQDFTHPDGQVSLFGDGGLHATYQPAECLRAYAAVIGHEPSREDRYLAYEQAGYYGWRRGPDLFLFDCGPLAPDHLPAHGHGDALSFEWSIEGQRVIVDAGVYEYNAGPRREESRATFSHNTVSLDRIDQSEFWKSFRVGRRARIVERQVEFSSDGVRIAAAHDGYRRLPGSPVHRRQVIYVGDSLVIDDQVEGGCGQRAEAVLLLHPDCRLVRSDAQTLEIEFGAGALVIECVGKLTTTEAQWYPDQGVALPTIKIIADYGPAPCHGSLRLRVHRRSPLSSV
jgi:uncharacterized heparinase superfamily protein